MTPDRIDHDPSSADAFDSDRHAQLMPTPNRLEQPAGGSSTLNADIVPTRLLTIPEVREMCALSEKTIRRAIERGELRAMKLCNRMRVAPEDLVAWQHQHEVHPRDLGGDDRYRRSRARRPIVEGGLRELLDNE